MMKNYRRSCIFLLYLPLIVLILKKNVPNYKTDYIGLFADFAFSSFINVNGGREIQVG